MIAAILLCWVIAVSDGDTLTARCDPAVQAQQAENTPATRIRVRLDGIDAPELNQPYGKRARNALRKQVLHKKVQLRCHKIDMYQRHVCSVWAAPSARNNQNRNHAPYTLDVGLNLVTRGLAWWYRHYAHEQTPQQRGQYEFAEKKARAGRAGLWAARHPPVPPWTWRARGRLR